MQPLQFTIQNLSFERNYRTLFENINLNLIAGDLLQVRGNNGSGKSTLLRILAGYIEALNGKILLGSQPIINCRHQLHYLGHQNGVKPYLTVYENLNLNSALVNRPVKPDHIKMILKKIGLSHAENRQAQYLSAGQNRRLALGRLLLHSQPLWILDEPTTSLDIHAQDLMKELLEDHLKQGNMAIVATHQDLSCVSKMIEMEHYHV